ncbi:hypothetical protein [Microbacterium oleivorans]|uniref:hypothetical protein n=1 Tax=Microbacterium oleivorans TaxID=273677 RepID=UPI000AC9E6FC|nr:hypothetical protein [Microbacterium oleivorans]
MPREMTEVGFEPRDMFAQPKAFGVVNATPSPADGVRADDWRYRAAVVQHRFSRAVNDGLKLRGRHRREFLAQYADVRSLSVGRMGRVLRGEQVATMADLAFWAEHFPEVVERLREYFDWWVQDQKRLADLERERRRS